MYRRSLKQNDYIYICVLIIYSLKTDAKNFDIALSLSFVLVMLHEGAVRSLHS